MGLLHCRQLLYHLSHQGHLVFKSVNIGKTNPTLRHFKNVQHKIESWGSEFFSIKCLVLNVSEGRMIDFHVQIYHIRELE